MTNKIIRIGTRESQLAVWQATQVKSLLEKYGFASELVYIKSEGDLDLKTPLYEMGVQGIFTRSLDAARRGRCAVPRRVRSGGPDPAGLDRGRIGRSSARTVAALRAPC